MTQPNVDNLRDWVNYILCNIDVYKCEKILMVMWALWFSRNRGVMEGKQQSADEIRTKVESLLREFLVIKDRLPAN